MSGSSINSVFYAESYHPIQAGSIDGTDIAPHDNAVLRAHLCSTARLYDPLGDPKLLGDPYCTVFVGRLSHLTTEESLRKAMSKYGHVKNLRLVRDIVTGASRGYAFVEYESDREMRRAYKDAHHSLIDDSEIIVDYSRQQLMPGWIPRRLGGGLGGRKESGQLRFGGRERPFRAPLRPIPYDDLKRLGIPPPPEGRYMSRFQVPSPPRRKQRSIDMECSRRRSSIDKECSSRSSSVELEERYNKRKLKDEEENFSIRHYEDREEHQHKRSSKESEYSHRRSSSEREYQRYKSSVDREKHHEKSSHVQREGSSHKRYEDMGDTVDRDKYHEKSSHVQREGSSNKRYVDVEDAVDREKHHEKSSHVQRGGSHKRYVDVEDNYDRRSFRDREEKEVYDKHHKREKYVDMEDNHGKRSSKASKEEEVYHKHHKHERYVDMEDDHGKRSSKDSEEEEVPHRPHKHSGRSSKRKSRRSTSHDRSSGY